MNQSKENLKVPFSDFCDALGLDDEERDSDHGFALKFGALVTIGREDFILPQKFSKASAKRNNEIYSEAKEVGYIGNAVMSVRTCLLSLSNLTFLIEYVLGMTSYSDTITSTPELRSAVLSMLADREEIHDCLIKAYEHLLQLTIAEAEKTKSTKSPIAKCLKQ